MKKKLVAIGIVIMGAMIYLGGCTSTTQKNGDTNTKNTDTSALQQNETEIRIPLSTISTTATFYPYDSDGVTVRYFTVKDAQGMAKLSCHETRWVRYGHQNS